MDDGDVGDKEGRRMSKSESTIVEDRCGRAILRPGLKLRQKRTSKSSVNRRSEVPKKPPYWGSAMFECTSSGLKWLVRLRTVPESRTEYFAFTRISFETRRSREKYLGKRGC